MLDSLKAATRVTVTGRCLYDYYIRPGESLVTRFYDKKFEVCCLIDEKIRAFVAASHEEAATFRYMYLKSVVSCIVNFYGPSCPYSFGEKRRQVSAMLHHPQVREQVRFSAKNGLAGNLLCLLIRHPAGAAQYGGGLAHRQGQPAAAHPVYPGEASRRRGGNGKRRGVKRSVGGQPENTGGSFDAIAVAAAVNLSPGAADQDRLRVRSPRERIFASYNKGA